jgi:hypothetical protein
MKIEQRIILLLLILFSGQVEAIRIEGSQPGWAGHTLEFVTWTDPVSKNEKPVFSLKIDQKGTFSTEVKISEITYCYSDFGVFSGKLLLVPDQDIKITLPPFREMSFEERKNPYFEPVGIWLITDDENALTNLVSRFDTRFNLLTEKYFDQLFYKNLKNYLDTVRILLDKQFSLVRNPDFDTHRMLRLKSLEADISRSGREKIAGKLLLNGSYNLNQPAFIDFLDRLFVTTLSVESKTPSGKNLKQWVAQKNLSALNKWTENFTATSGPFSDIILLKMLHDAFYSGEFSKSAILQILQSTYYVQHPMPQIRKASQEITAKLTFLFTGTSAPEICLSDLNGKAYCSRSTTAPYLYILFADLEIPVCREQVKYLKTMSEKTGSGLQILLVLLPSSRVNIADFIAMNQIPGVTVIDSGNTTFGKKYKVRSYPSAFLLNTSHKVILAPAKTPLDGFEYQFVGYKMQ